MTDAAGDATGVLVVGYGSELRSDDAAGRRVAEAIERRALPGVTVVMRTQLVPELAEMVAGVARVVFVDASVAVEQVVVRSITPELGGGGSHHATPAQLLGLVETVGLRCPPAFLVEVPAADLTLGEGLSAPTARAVDQAIDEVLSLVADSVTS